MIFLITTITIKTNKTLLTTKQNTYMEREEKKIK